jgi:hypothetical protein
MLISRQSINTGAIILIQSQRSVRNLLPVKRVPIKETTIKTVSFNNCSAREIIRPHIEV